MKIKTKLFVIISLLVIFTMIFSLVLVSYNIKKNGDEEVKRFAVQEKEDRKEILKNYVDIAYETIVSEYNKTQDTDYIISAYGVRLKNIIDLCFSIIDDNMDKVSRGLISDNQARENSLETIRSFRFDNDVGYVWINDMEKPIPRMIMHPTLPNLNGKVLDDPQYNCANGTDQNLFQAFAEVCEKSGKGYVEYYWPKPVGNGLSENVPKLSYVRLYKKWNWVIGTGVYIDDVVKDSQERVLQTISGMRYNKNVGYFWITDNGKPVPRIIMQPVSPELDGKILDDPKYKCVKGTDQNLFQAFVEVCEDSGEGYVDYFWPKPTHDGLTEDKEKISFVKLFGKWDWIIGTGEYVDDIDLQISIQRKKTNANIQTLIFSTSIAFIFILGLGIIFILMTSNSFTKPILLLVNSIDQVGKGELNTRIKVFTRDELGNLSNNFNKFIGILRNMIGNLQKATTKSRNVGTNLATNCEELSATIKNMNNNINNMQSEIVQLDENITKSKNALSDIRSFTDFVLESVTNEASSVTESSSSIEEMVRAINNITRITQEKKSLTDKLSSMGKIGEKDMLETLNSIEMISKSANVILNLIQVINNVAKKTNLLAMNAAIEAAHAGSSGKGFAVVAEEIKKLAETTSVNAADITNSLGEILSHIEAASVVTKKTGESIGGLISGIDNIADGMNEMMESMNELSLSGNQIMESLGILIKITNGIKSSMKELSLKTEFTDNSMQEIAKLSNDNLIEIQAIASGISQITESTHVLFEMVEINKESIFLIDNEISFFHYSPDNDYFIEERKNKLKLDFETQDD